MSLFIEPEGATELNADDIKGLKFSHITTRDELNELENANIIQGVTWLSSQPVTQLNDVISMSFIEQLHIKLFGDVWDWAGQYRTRELNIGVAPHAIRMDLYNLLEDIKCWIEFNHFDLLELSARIQHRLVQIHPFTNGNGRHSRIITDYVRVALFKQRPLTWANTDLDKQNQERGEYISSLREADKGNYQPFIDYLKIRGN